VDPERCLGCGVCDDACRYEAHAMVPRPVRAWVPKDTFERVVAMAIERQKLGDLLYDLSEREGAHALARALRVLERTPVARRLAAIEPLRSTFLRGLVATMQHAG
jgi:hypothetical protein